MLPVGYMAGLPPTAYLCLVTCITFPQNQIDSSVIPCINCYFLTGIEPAAQCIACAHYARARCAISLHMGRIGGPMRGGPLMLRCAAPLRGSLHCPILLGPYKAKDFSCKGVFSSEGPL